MQVRAGVFVQPPSTVLHTRSLKHSAPVPHEPCIAQLTAHPHDCEQTIAPSQASIPQVTAHEPVPHVTLPLHDCWPLQLMLHDSVAPQVMSRSHESFAQPTAQLLPPHVTLPLHDWPPRHETTHASVAVHVMS